MSDEVESFTLAAANNMGITEMLVRSSDYLALLAQHKAMLIEFDAATEEWRLQERLKDEAVAQYDALKKAAGEMAQAIDDFLEMRGYATERRRQLDAALAAFRAATKEG